MNHGPPSDGGGGEDEQQTGNGRHFAPPLRFYSIMINAHPIHGEGGESEQPLEGRSVVHIFFERNAFDDINFRKASARAVRSLKRVPLDQVQQSDRECTICYEPLTEWDGVERRPQPEEQDDNQNNANEGETNQSGEESIDDHSPVEMPCGHIFGMSCLRGWLKTAKSCPLCRRKVESRGEYLQIHDTHNHGGEEGTPEPFRNEGTQNTFDQAQMSPDFRSLREMQWGSIRRQIQEMPEDQLPPVLRQFLARQHQGQGEQNGDQPRSENAQDEGAETTAGQDGQNQDETGANFSGMGEQPEIEMQMPPPFLRGIIPIMVQQVREALERSGQPGRPFRFSPSPSPVPSPVPSPSPASSTSPEQPLQPQQQEESSAAPSDSENTATDRFDSSQAQHPGDERRRGPERQTLRRRHPYTRPS